MWPVFHLMLKCTCTFIDTIKVGLGCFVWIQIYFIYPRDVDIFVGVHGVGKKQVSNVIKYRDLGLFHVATNIET